MTSYTVLLWSAAGDALLELRQPLRLRYGRALNGAGPFEVDVDPAALPPSFARGSTWRDARADVYRSVGGHAARYEGSFILSTRAGNTFSGNGIVQLLDRRLILTTLASSAPAETAMKQAVTSQFVTYAGRVASLLAVEPDRGTGATVTVETTNKDVLTYCGDVAQQSAAAGTPIYFDLVASGARLTFTTWTGLRGQERRRLFSEAIGTLAESVGTWDYRNVATSVRVPSSGGLVGQASRPTVGAFGLIERYVNAGNATTQDQLNAEAAIALRQTAPVFRYSGRLLDTPESRYGVDWALGDTVPVDYSGQELRCRIDAISVQYDGTRGTDTVNAVANAEVTL